MRHQAKVTSDRLLADVERWHERFTPVERDAVALIRRRLQDIADEDMQQKNEKEDLPSSCVACGGPLHGCIDECPEFGDPS